MPKRNRHRSETSQNVHLLEQALSLRDRLFSMLALKRGLTRLRRWGIGLLLVAGIAAGSFYAASKAMEKASSLSIDKVTYDSSQRLISKEQAMAILGIEGAVNLATLDAKGMEAKLKENLCIKEAHVRVAAPDTLRIDVDERIPIAYVEMESAASTGQRERLFVCPDGVLFPVVPEYHRNFLNAPVWYLQPTDVKALEPDERIKPENMRPICELIKASNHYDIAEIPRIREIFRPKEWKIVLTLEDGTEVLMQVYDIREQMDRLAMILEHARSTHRHARSVNVIPRMNPTIIYRTDETDADGDGKTAEEEEKDKKEADKGRSRSSSRRR